MLDADNSDQDNNGKMKEKIILLTIIALVVGSLIGTLYINETTKTKGEDDQYTSLHPVPAVNSQNEIQDLQEILAKDPENRKAWVQLGNKYFNTQQLTESIEAYDKALAIDGSDPNVLTKQGIAFRLIDRYDKAVENFDKANKLNPKHTQSLYNLGFVYRDDLQENDKAKEVWLRYLEIDSTGAAADWVRAMIEKMEKGQK